MALVALVASLLALVVAHPAQAAFPGANGKIGFESNRDGNDEIYVMNALDGANQTNLTKNPGNDYLPSWDPDPKNQIIAFASSRDGNSEIYVMDTNGNFQFNLTRNPGGDFDRR